MRLTTGPNTPPYTHPQPLGQSRNYHRPRRIEPIANANTAGPPPIVTQNRDQQHRPLAPPHPPDQPSDPNPRPHADEDRAHAPPAADERPVGGIQILDEHAAAGHRDPQMRP